MTNFHIHLSDKSQKVWGFNSYSNDKEQKYNIIFYYGRAGIPMQRLNKTNKSFSSYCDCYDHLHKKIKEKLGKDYISLSTNDKYFDLVSRYNLKDISKEALLLKVEKLIKKQ